MDEVHSEEDTSIHVSTGVKDESSRFVNRLLGDGVIGLVKVARKAVCCGHENSKVCYMMLRSPDRPRFPRSASNSSCKPKRNHSL